MGPVGAMRRGAVLGASLIAIASCGGSDSGTNADAGSAVTTTASPTSPPTTTPSKTPPTTAPLADDEVEDAAEPCVITVAAGDSLSKIADQAESATLDEIMVENYFGDDHVIHPNDQIDVCIGNDIDDVTGASRLAPGPAAVRRQQTRLNELFAPYLIAELAVDGDSGKLTRQMLCAARMGMGLPVDTSHMAPGSDEEAALFETESLNVPKGAAVWANRWVLIDKTCQVMFVGEGENGISNVYPTSTGESGFETRDALAAAAFRFDPAVDNDGWHDSSRFPVEADNPQNGNMYKPIYFNEGQAIHGANYVPPVPRSKGCARMFPWHQDHLIAWLGLDHLTDATWRESQIGTTVTVQGDYRFID